MAVMTENVKGQREYRGSSGADRMRERRERLIEAAIAVYAERGYPKASVRAICKEAKLTERYFYESFASGEDLLVAAFETISDELFEVVDAADSGGEPEQRIHARLRAYYDALHQRPSATRVFFIDTVNVSKRVDVLFEHAIRRFERGMAELLDMPAPASDTVDLRLRGVSGGLHQIALAWMREDFARPTTEVVEIALRFCLAIRGTGM
ncbi:MAG: TetR/AcrR family transcriptional regulator [Sphingopyxis sp.]|uniref:TetR/AcrR family transcriptional regulator n=1 Tax=Sphingopyxis sp. TaxID=1908224 RepID=UPI001A34925F|nr:TetR/AcrR family transcriptional regulator [Sphingopyxis sp.]MBJ7500097.1 TetR/AcrR family transcriptional regulator [Sphingopyxis sp.]